MRSTSSGPRTGEGSSPVATSSDRVSGKVKWFNDAKGFGFITVSEGPYAGQDVFCHFSAIEGGKEFKTVEEGATVTLKVVPGKDGKFAAAEVQK